MRAFVITDASFERQAGRFVWLEIDTENDANAALVERLKADALPSYFVLDPSDEKVVRRWVGSFTVAQLHGWLDEAGLARPAAPTSSPGTARAEAAFARAEALNSQARYADAVPAFTEALEHAPADWPMRARATDDLLSALSSADEPARCAKVGLQASATFRGTATGANGAGVGLDCALSLPEDHPARVELLRELEAATREALADRSLPLSADDRSGLYGTLHSARDQAKDAKGARDVASEWVAYLDAEAARADTPEKRTTYDPDRLTAYLALGEPARAIPMLEASQLDFPDDYNPPARLAVVYRELKRWDEGLAAAERALKRVYGPRKLRVYQTKVDLLLGRGDKAAARATLEEAAQYVRTLPPGSRSEALRAAVQKRIDALPQ